MPAVSNSSPLIFLAAIDRLELLHDIYDEILVPPEVWRETVTAGANRAGTFETKQARWIRQQPLLPGAIAAIQAARLDAGETEAIALALSFSPPLPIILDDLPARLVALNAGLAVTGTGGVIALAKRRNLVPSFSSLLAELRSAGLYLSDSAAEQLRELAGER